MTLFWVYCISQLTSADQTAYIASRESRQVQKLHPKSTLKGTVPRELCPPDYFMIFIDFLPIWVPYSFREVFRFWSRFCRVTLTELTVNDSEYVVTIFSMVFSPILRNSFIKLTLLTLVFIILTSWTQDSSTNRFLCRG